MTIASLKPRFHFAANAHKRGLQVHIVERCEDDASLLRHVRPLRWIGRTLEPPEKVYGCVWLKFTLHAQYTSSTAHQRQSQECGLMSPLSRESLREITYAP